jgi:hypothetical protein
MVSSEIPTPTTEEDLTMPFSEIPTSAMANLTMASRNEQTFNLTGLPAELQFAIIRATCEPRIIAIEFGGEDPINEDKVLRCLTRAPIAVHINRAYRKETQKHYTLLEYNGSHQDGYTKWPRIYLNFSMDLIEFVPSFRRLYPEGQYSLYSRMLSQSIFGTYLKPDQAAQLSIIHRECERNCLGEQLNLFYCPSYFPCNQTLEFKETIIVLRKALTESEDRISTLMQFLEGQNESAKEKFGSDFGGERVGAIGHLEWGVGCVFWLSSLGGFVTSTTECRSAEGRK